jgi:hypothetical protein
MRVADCKTILEYKDSHLAHILLYIDTYNSNGELNKSLREIQKETNIPMNNLRKCLNTLIEKQIIEKIIVENKTTIKIKSTKQKSKSQNTVIDENKYLKERQLLRSVVNCFDNKIIEKLSKIEAEKWAETIHKLHEIDNYDYETIKSVIIFARNDDFWKQNFLSVATLRNKKNGVTKFQQILNKYKNGNNTETRREKLTSIIRNIQTDPDLE